MKTHGARGRPEPFCSPKASGFAHLHLNGNGAGAGAGLGRARALAVVGHQDGEPVQPLLLIVQRPQEADLTWKG